MADTERRQPRLEVQDEMEEVQLSTGAEVLEHARAILGDAPSEHELRFLAQRLSECLSDALNVAASRGTVPVKPAQPAPRQKAARALKELRAALDAHGIALPGLSLDGPSLVAADASPVTRPLVELGRVNLTTALKLAYALRIMEGQ